MMAGMMTGAVAAYLRTPRVKAAAVFYLLLSVLLSQTPLFNYLGYEFSAAMTVPAAFVSGLLTLHWLRDHRSMPMTGRTWLSVLGVYLTINLLLLLIPFAVISLNALFVKNCAFALGAVYFLLLPIVTMVFSVSLALVTGMLFRRSALIFSAAVAGLLLHIVFITVFQPQLFAYNFILGFFPGITYDETLTDIGALVLYRGLTMIAALMLFSVFSLLLRSIAPRERVSVGLHRMRRNAGRDSVLWGAVAVCTLTLGTAHIFRDDLGYEYSASDIQEGLGRRTESAHFIVYYRQEDHPAVRMQRMKAEMEYHYRVVTARLGIIPPAEDKIAVYLYPDSDQKHRYIGTANTNIAKPWLREIHLTTATFTGSFRHELVHIIAGEFGLPLLRASLRMGLNEGLAVSTDWDEGMFTPHQYAAAIAREGGLDEASTLFTMTGFASRSSTFAYLVTGSFIRYLTDRFGIDRVRDVFGSGNFVTVFGEPLDVLMGEWKAFLRTVDATEIPAMTVEALFSTPSIFYKTCPRTVAEQNRNAAAALRERRFEDAERLFAESFRNASAATSLRGMYHAMIASGRAPNVIVHYDSLTKGSLLRTNPAILLVLGDAYTISGERNNAAAVYGTISSMNFSESFQEASLLRLLYIADSIDAETVRTMFYGGLSDKRRVEVLDSVQRSFPTSSALGYHRAVLSESGSPNTLKGLPAGLQYAALARSAERALENGEFERAKGLYWQAKNAVPTAALSERLDDRIELCDFILTELQ